MATVSKEILIDRSPDDVWKVVGDIGGISDWMPMIETSSADGDTRYYSIAAGGGDLIERILDKDDSSRCYEYTIVEGPMPLTSHRASFAVDEVDGSTRVSWEMELEPDNAAEMMGGVAEQGLLALKTHLE